MRSTTTYNQNKRKLILTKPTSRSWIREDQGLRSVPLYTKMTPGNILLEDNPK